MGAKSKLTPENKVKLNEAYIIDASMEETALLCGVSKQTLYNWKKEEPEYFDALEQLRNQPVLDARRTVVEKSQESYSNAMDYLKRKKKAEFGDSSTVEITTPKPLLDALQENETTSGE